MHIYSICNFLKKKKIPAFEEDMLSGLKNMHNLMIQIRVTYINFIKVNFFSTTSLYYTKSHK